MNIGYVATVSGLNKIIQLKGIRIVYFNSTSMVISYNGGSNSPVPQLENLVITYSPSDYTIDLIKTLFYQWLENSLVANSIEYLNDYLPSLKFIDVGLLNQQSNGAYIAAATEAIACAAAPTDTIYLDYQSASGSPPINTFVYTKTGNIVAPIADGTYSLLVSSITYFAEIVGSRIATIVVCPFLLDFIYDPNLQANNVANTANFFGAGVDVSPPFNGGLCYWGQTSVGGPTPGTALDESVNCGQNISATSGLWPSGLIYNGNLTAAEGLGQLPAFGVVLADDTTTSFTNANLFYSVNYYSDPTTATWSPFITSQLNQGLPGFGNGTANPFPCAMFGAALQIKDYMNRRFLFPGGTSLRNPAQTIANAAEVFISDSGNLVNFVPGPSCNN